MNKLRPVTEAEVIWEFLRTEFHHRDFDRDRHRFSTIVQDGSLSDGPQNAIRRALFYRRRGHLWNQLPPDTQWWQVSLEDADLDRLCVFARTHWRKIGGGNCLLRHVVERIRTRDFHGVRVVGGSAHGGVEISDVGRKVAAIRAFSSKLPHQPDQTAVVLIGPNDDQENPVTILEGNHRLAAALLASPDLLKRKFRVFFGESPAMARCCWYGAPTLVNMLRYAGNRLKHFGNPEADIERVMARVHPTADAPFYPASPSPGKAVAK
jgi:hypothetical protein